MISLSCNNAVHTSHCDVLVIILNTSLHLNGTRTLVTKYINKLVVKATNCYDAASMSNDCSSKYSLAL